MVDSQCGYQGTPGRLPPTRDILTALAEREAGGAKPAKWATSPVYVVKCSCATALAMATHRRLGARSPLRIVPGRMLQYIFSFIRHSYLPSLTQAEGMSNKQILAVLRGARVLDRHLPAKTPRFQLFQVLAKFTKRKDDQDAWDHANNSETLRIRQRNIAYQKRKEKYEAKARIEMEKTSRRERE